MAMIGTDTFNNLSNEDQENPNSYDDGEGVEVEVTHQEMNGDVQYKDSDSAAPGFDPNNLRFDVKSTDMSENMVLFVAEKTILAFEFASFSLETQKEGVQLDMNTLIAKFIKNEMELFYKHTWHVIVGDDYGGYFTHEQFNSCVFVMNKKWITVFKSNVPNQNTN